MNNETKQIKKRSTTLAWISLIILIGAAGGLTYLKFFGRVMPSDGGTATSSEKTSPAVLEALTSITDNFNSDSKIKEYEKNNTKISAVLEETTIKVTYQGTETKSYDFKLETPNLIVKNTTNDSAFEEVFTIMVRAIQKRLDNENNVDEYIKKFLEDDAEVTGLSKEIIEANEVKYQITVGQKIGATEETEDENATTQENANDKTSEERSVSAGVVTTPKAGE